MDPKKPTRPAGQKSTSQKPTGQKPAGKPAKKSASTTEYVFGWLGRQVGHVKKAVQSDVTKPAAKKPQAAAQKPTAAQASGTPKSPSRAAASPAPSEGATLSEKVIFRQDKVEEAEMPHQPGVILRRTIIDEVVVEREVKDGTKK
ncbi:hypothetical protein [Humisphaera borealis]|uniref:Uncharacterized protein n=1 Tax=Humisphaera borealis TaxID=2807512 RepID=A0A7M2WPZ1_9BACT|nr:hypothetical protein [Humisphaera borealis]QOV87538.1 hypothetical protein IPV69_14700 [Humisphaera borealis]